jgi:hypothetical protein
VNRQEEDLIKKIDFKYDCHLYNNDESNSKHVHLNISNLFGDQNFSLNETINAAQLRECNESESLINVPHQIHLVPFHQRLTFI